MARSSGAGGTEPQDAVRVVNVLLTQLDRMKELNNVLIMATSNLSESIGTSLPSILCIDSTVQMLHSWIEQI